MQHEPPQSLLSRRRCIPSSSKKPTRQAGQTIAVCRHQRLHACTQTHKSTRAGDGGDDNNREHVLEVTTLAMACKYNRINSSALLSEKLLRIAVATDDAVRPPQDALTANGCDSTSSESTAMPLHTWRQYARPSRMASERLKLNRSLAPLPPPPVSESLTVTFCSLSTSTFVAT